MKKTIMLLLLAFAVLMSGCGDTAADGVVSPVTGAPTDVSAADASELFTDRDFETDYDESTSAIIRLEGSTATCTSDAVQISGSTITITDEGTYVLSGTLNDGMIIVNSEETDKTRLVLNGVTIHSENCAPIYILRSEKVFITLVEGTTNTLSNGGTFAAIDENNIDGVVFSKEDLTLNGSGTLVVTSPGGHGIVSKDSLTVTGGTYDINCASHGLAGKDDVCIAGGVFSVVSGKDGIHAENADDTASGYVYILGGTFSVSAEGDGISASAHMQIDGGVFTITSGGGSANASSATSGSWGDFMGGGRHPQGGRNGGNAGGTAADETDSTSIKGIKAAGALTITGGVFCIDSADDAVHSNASCAVGGGTFDIASGDDAFHADETLTILNGSINITRSYEGLEGLHIFVSGGEITLVASDDGLNAAGGVDSSGTTGGRDGRYGGGGRGGASSNGSITISGGTLHITASGDGIDANGSLAITGGYTVVCGPAQGDTSTLDYDTSASISGGTFIGTGASGMAQTFGDSGQGVIAVNAGRQGASTPITLTDREGTVIIEYAPNLSFDVVILSSPDIVPGESYILSVGSTSEEFTAS